VGPDVIEACLATDVLSSVMQERGDGLLLVPTVVED
jgi:hypothetical protein